LKAVQERSAKLEGLDAFLASGRHLVKLRYSNLAESTHAYGVHRGCLFEQLWNLCKRQSVEICTSSTVAQFESNDDCVKVIDRCGVDLGSFDFLIAADGSNSPLRRAAPIPCRSIEYPYSAIWTTGTCQAVDRRLYQVVDGTHRLVGLLPIGEGQCSFFWGLKSSEYQALVQRGLAAWKDEVNSLCPHAQGLLECIDDFEQLTFAGYRHVRMKQLYSDRIVFIGDAAHPSSPHLGQGVNLALEDAQCFTNALRQTGDFELACRMYQRQRIRKLRYYQQLTRLLTPFFQSDIPLLAMGRDLALPWLPTIPWIRTRMLRTLCGIQPGWF